MIRFQRMKKNKSRRKFLSEAAVGVSVAALASPLRIDAARVESQESRPAAAAAALRGTPPISVSSANGLAAVNKAVEVMRGGGDTLDAVIAGVNIVELDASVMHGPTRRAGAVASIRGVREPSKVARAVLESTDHILIVGQGARDFATAHGFEDTNLLTEESRIAWLRWKETLSPTDKWGPTPYLPSPASPAGQKKIAEGARSARASDRLAEAYANGDARRREEVGLRQRHHRRALVPRHPQHVPSQDLLARRELLLLLPELALLLGAGRQAERAARSKAARARRHLGQGPLDRRALVEAALQPEGAR